MKPHTALERRWYIAGLKAAENIVHNLGHCCGRHEPDHECADRDSRLTHLMCHTLAAKRKKLEGR